ncbi:CBS domain-containing protein [Methylomonas methanica]|uniref:CBS domain-containing protein n=1 Tax=Methylomonas methanica TaxID=421 RepID=UPI0009ED91A6|nr:CBS domain-containing protein [Methylomonas methanica]
MTIRSVSQLIDHNNVSSVVLEIGEEYFVFSVEDLLKHLHSGGSSEATLAGLALRKITCVFENERVLTAFEILETSGDRYLGVVDAKESLVGILTDTDILSTVDPTVLVQKNHRRLGDQSRARNLHCGLDFGRCAQPSPENGRFYYCRRIQNTDRHHHHQGYF